jgi:hypothetical protein
MVSQSDGVLLREASDRLAADESTVAPIAGAR